MISWILRFSISLSTLSLVLTREDVWNSIPCDEEHQPSNCDLDKHNVVTVDYYERCGPAKLPLHSRNYFLAAAGRRITYTRNKDAFDEIKIVPRTLLDISRNTTETSILGMKLDFPIGLSPVGYQKFAHPQGELATVAGITPFRTIMILSSFATARLEDVTKAAHDTSIHLWMQIYIFDNLTLTTSLIERAERSGFKGIVITVDSTIESTLTCDGRGAMIYYGDEAEPQNLNQYTASWNLSAGFQEITRIRNLTKLPIIVKGILSGEDAIRAISAGASAILVSNHGGRQMDGAPATIEALPRVVDAVNRMFPGKDIYMDGGVRSGHDIYKALALGAKMVFVGRPVIWGLALEGSNGVNNVITTLKNEFQEVMLIAGATTVDEIRRDTLILPFQWLRFGDEQFSPLSTNIMQSNEKLYNQEKLETTHLRHPTIRQREFCHEEPYIKIVIYTDFRWSIAFFILMISFIVFKCRKLIFEW